MRVDVHTLGAFNGVAQQGAEAASGAFRTLTGESVDVAVRGVNIAPAAAVRSQIDDRQAAVVMALSGGVTGRAILTFSPSDAGRLRSVLPTEIQEPSEVVLEVGNILVGRLLDDIANALGTGITVSPPAGVSAGKAFDDDVLFLFECRLEAPKLGVTFDLYLRLHDGAFDRLLEAHDQFEIPSASGGPSVRFDELAQFAELVSDGVDQAASHASMMTGFEFGAVPNGLRFVTVSELAQLVRQNDRVGTAFSLSEPPGGFVLISFDNDSAAHMGSAMIPGEPIGGLDGMVKDAVVELGNIMTSGLIDGWESLFGAAIDHSAPRLIGDSVEEDLLDPFVDWLGEERQYGFLVDSTIQTTEGNIGCDIYSMPDELELLEALDRAK